MVIYQPVNLSANQVANMVNARRRISALAMTTTHDLQIISACQSVPPVKTVSALRHMYASV